jgi:hypothetical protein
MLFSYVELSAIVVSNEVGKCPLVTDSERLGRSGMWAVRL